MDFAKIRPRGGTKAQWKKANPVLAKREIGVQWETTIGVGEVIIKIGDGVNNWINLQEAVKSDITKKIIAALAVVPDDDPDLADGDSLDTLFGKIAKKFKYLKDNKLDKSARYDGTDSTSTELVPTANALRGVNAKADKNASDIMTLNNNLSNASKVVQVTTADHGFSMGYEADNGLYALVDLTKFYLASKSDLFANNYQTNPDLVTTPFAAINGFSNAVTNIPDDAKNTWNSLQTIWLFPNDIGDLTKNRLQVIITGNNTSHRRMCENGKFSDWS